MAFPGFRVRPQGLRALWAAVLCVSWCVGPVNAGDVDGRGRVLDTNDGFPCIVGVQGEVHCPGNDLGTEGPWPGQSFVSVATGDWGDCGLHADGEAVCRSGLYQPGTWPSGRWRQLAVGTWGGCGTRPDGSLGCWGALSGLAQTLPTDGPFLSVSIGDHDACALRTDGTLACWNERLSGDPDFGAPPAGRFLRVDVGPNRICALRSGGSLACWGPDGGDADVVPVGSDFVDVSVGAFHVCALRIDGEVVCGGTTRRYGTPVAMPSPPGRFTLITSRGDRACGRRADGSFTCWGDGIPEQALQAYRHVDGTPLSRMSAGGGEVCVLDPDAHAHCVGTRPALAAPPGRYLELALAADRACGIDLQQRAQCWGASLGPVPPAPMASIAVAGQHACAVGVDERLVCWGSDGIGQGAVPEGAHRRVVTATDYACALSTAGTVACWGTNPLVSGIPVGNGFTRLYAGDRMACAARDGQALQCWGDVRSWMRLDMIAEFDDVAIGDRFLCWLVPGDVVCKGDPAAGVPLLPSGIFTAASAFADTLCAVDDTARVACVGAQPLQAQVATRRAGLERLAAGTSHTCGLDDAGTLRCWGRDNLGQTSPVADEALAIDANGDHACAITATGTLRCWGDGQRDANLPPPGLQVRDVDVGQFGGCGIVATGDVRCWGWNANGQASPPAGAFRRVATGLNHGCGVRDDSTLACWGYAADGQTVAPAGTYLTVDVGERHSCAIAGDGRLRCWGLDSEGQSTPPADDARYVALAVGPFHACAIRGDGTLACWGRNDHGQATPPVGRFVTVAAGGAHTCAVRDDGTRACWGDNGAGQAPSLSFTPATLPPAAGGYGNPYEAQFTVAGSGGYVPRNPRFRMVDAGQLDPAVLSEDGHLFLYTYDDHALYRFTVEVRDANGFVARREYALQVGPSADTTPPEIDVSISGPMGDNGWYIGDVGIAWQVDDRESGIVDAVGCGPLTITSDVVAFVSCTAVNRAGVSRSESHYIRRDATPPQIFVWYWPESAPNANGWYRTPEHARFACDDLTSGTLDPCPPDADFLTEGVHIPPLRTVRDRAGNIATTSQAPIRIDWTAPLLDAVMPPSQLPAGTVHDYHATASDALSGVDSLVCTPVDSTPYQGQPGGPERIAQCTATDRAGNATVIRSTYTVVAPIAPAKARMLRGSRLPALPARSRSGHRAAR